MAFIHNTLSQPVVLEIWADHHVNNDFWEIDQGEVVERRTRVGMRSLNKEAVSHSLSNKKKRKKKDGRDDTCYIYFKEIKPFRNLP